MRYQPRVVSLLDDLEHELKRMDYWRDDPPSADALESVAPFCYDTMDLTQWLQWVFIPRLRQVVITDQALPAPCEILPAAELYFEQTGLPAGRLLPIIGELDSKMPAPMTN